MNENAVGFGQIEQKRKDEVPKSGFPGTSGPLKKGGDIAGYGCSGFQPLREMF
jgi:hypothetical protein